MKLNLKKILQTLLFFGIGLFIVYYQINQLSVEEKSSALKAIKGANYYWIFIAFSCAIFSHILRGFRWAMLINTANENVKPRNAFYAVVIGYLVNGFIPRFGEIVRCGVLGKKENVKFEKLVGTVVAERLFDLIMLISVIGITLIIQYDFLYSLINESLLQPFLERLSDSSNNLMIIAALFTGTIIFFFFGFRYLIKKSTIGSRLKERWINFKEMFTEGFNTILKLKNKWWLFITQSIAMWFLYFLMSFLVFKSLDGSKHLGIDAGLSALTSGSLGLLIPTPGGLGSFHEFVSRTLQLYDISEVLGVSLSWLIWSTSFSSILVMGLIAIVLIGINNK